MITFDLSCDREHRFEGWFRNLGDFEDQLRRGLVSCPVCGSNQVTKRVSAVAVHVARRSAEPPAPAPQPEAPAKKEATAESFFRAVSQFIEQNFDDVGSAFAAEARKIEKGETEERNIRGTTTPEEEEALREEGVDFFKVALPKYDA